MPTFLKTTQIAPRIYQVIGTNAIINGQDERDWRLSAGDDFTDQEWIHTFNNKNTVPHALLWIVSVCGC